MFMSKASWFLFLLLLGISGTFADENYPFSKRGDWKEQRAKKLAESLAKAHNQLNVPTSPQFWMCSDSTSMELLSPEPSAAGGRAQGDTSNTTSNPDIGNDSDVEATTQTDTRKKRQVEDDASTASPPENPPPGPGPSPPSPGGPAPAPGPAPMPSPKTECNPTGDKCIDETIVIGFYYTGKSDGDREGIVISDLTNALKTGSNGKCVCAEEGAATEEVDGRMICIKKEKIKPGEECIHHAECMNKTNLCLFDAKKSPHGDIEDYRKFCSGSITWVPPIIVLLASLVVSSTMMCTKTKYI